MMRVDIWSDIVCPFCYLGKRNFEIALAQFEHRDEVEVRWHSFELDQNAREDNALPLAERIAAKYSLNLEESIATQEGIAEHSQEVGWDFNWRNAKYGNSFDAHRIIHHATAQGKAAEAQEAFKKHILRRDAPSKNTSPYGRLPLKSVSIHVRLMKYSRLITMLRTCALTNVWHRNWVLRVFPSF